MINYTKLAEQVKANQAESKKIIDETFKAEGLSNVSLKGITEGFLGRDIANDASAITNAFEVARSATLFQKLNEGDGGSVLPSTFINISGWIGAIGGLVGAQVMAAYDNPAFIASKIVPHNTVRVNEAKKIRSYIDGQTADVEVGEALPTVGLKQAYIDTQRLQRRGVAIKVTAETVLMDLSGTVMQSASEAGFATGRAKEVKLLRAIWGIDNTYSRNGTSINTYLTSPQSAPLYVNKADLQLTDWTKLNQAWYTLLSNKQPENSLELDIPLEQSTVWCMPHKFLNVKHILRSTTLTTPEQALASATQIRTGENPLPNMAIVGQSILPYNVLVNDGSVDATKAQDYFLFGRPEKAFSYNELYPLTTQQTVLSSQDVREGVSAVFVTSEMGVPVIDEPRYVFLGIKA